MIDISGIKAGDRVRITADNGDEVTFTVKRTDRHYLCSRHNSYYGAEWDTIEVLSPALPTEPGYYEASDRYPITDGFDAYRLTRGGKWYVNYVQLSDDDMRDLGRLARLFWEASPTNASAPFAR